MRAADVQLLAMFCYASVEDRVPADYPVRTLRVLVDAIPSELNGLVASRYSPVGRESILPEPP